MIKDSGFNKIQQQKLRKAAAEFGADLGGGAEAEVEVQVNVVDVPNGKKMKALYEYEAQKDSQIDLKVDDILIVINDNKKWWLVYHERTGKRGEVPSNFLAPYEDGYEDPDNIPRGGGGDDPFELPEEEEEKIYEPVNILPPEAEAGAAGAAKDLPEEDIDNDYADPDAYLDKVDVKKEHKPRPLFRRTDAAKEVPVEARPLPEDPRLWNSTEVLRWLTSEELKDFKDVFYHNGFEGPMLLTLKSSSFVAGGFDRERCKALETSLDKLKSNTKPLYQVRVTYSYEAQKKSQLSIKEGDVLDILDDSAQWYRARYPDTQKQGQVPSNYIEKIYDDAGAALDEVEDFTTFPWFKDLPRSAAEKFVSAGDVGGFVVRPSSSPGDYTLTALGPSGIMNLKIQQRDDKSYVLGQFSSRFVSIQELIQHHQTSAIKVHGKKSVTLKA